MGKVDYSSPLPQDSLSTRFGKVFGLLEKGQSATILALPHTGRSSNLRYLTKNKYQSTFFLDIDKITGNIESFIYQLIYTIGQKEPKSYQDLYLLNKELFDLIAEKTRKNSINLILTLKEKILPFSKDIDQILVHCQKSATNFPLNILWSIDTKVYRQYKKSHPSSTFGENLTFFPTFDKGETFHSLKRIMLSKSVNKNPEQESFAITGGVAGLFHSYLNMGKSLWSDELVQKMLQDIHDEIIKNKEILHKLITKNGLDVINNNIKISFNYKSIKLSSNPTAQEINILNFLLEQKSPVSRDDIAKIIWGKSWNSKYSDWAIDKTISRLRKKIDDNETKILTIKNFGYQLFQ